MIFYGPSAAFVSSEFGSVANVFCAFVSVACVFVCVQGVGKCVCVTTWLSESKSV